MAIASLSIAAALTVPLAETYFETGLVPADYRKGLATRLITHGLKANRVVLETAAKFSNQQGLTPRVMPMEELFAPNALES